MPIYQTAHYQVKASAVDKVKAAIEEFVAYVAANEPGSRMYTAWQQADDPTRFVHLFEFADEAAHQAHGSSTRSAASRPLRPRTRGWPGRLHRLPPDRHQPLTRARARPPLTGLFGFLGEEPDERNPGQGEREDP